MASKETYSVACIELFRRLWLELERMSVAVRSTHLDAGNLWASARAEMFRLELTLLLDACRSERWRLKLDISQRLSLQSTLEGVLDAVNASSEVMSQDAIARAQNCLFDAVIEHSAPYYHPIEAHPESRHICNSRRSMTRARLSHAR